MNRGLLVFALLLVLAGVILGLYLISFFGVLLLIPALGSASRPPQRQQQPQPQQEQTPRRISRAPPPPQTSPPSQEQAPPPGTGPMAPRMEAQNPSQMAPLTESLSPSAQSLSYTPALFPSPMLPSLSLMGSMAPPVKAPQEAKHRGQDDLIELGAMVALLKLIFG